MRGTQHKHEEYWRSRNLDWKAAYLETWNHPHRQLIVDALKRRSFSSLLELGCAAGANLLRIHTEFPEARLSGIDISPEAIETARRHLDFDVGLRTGNLAEIPFPDSSVDVVLTDMALIYVTGIESALEKVRRVVRNRIILCELHSENRAARLALRLATGYFAHDYRRLLEAQGWRHPCMERIPPSFWPGGWTQRYFGYIVTADK